MKKIFSIIAFIAIVVIMLSAGLSAKEKLDCATIQSGTIVDSAGNPITVGFDEYGYNYQAHMFNGFYDNYSRPLELVDSGNRLQMKWNDAWLSNKDCDGDGKLDRPSPYIGSDAWLTNHEEGVDENGDHYTYFVKIIAVPTTATQNDGVWYNEEGIEIGPVIWGSFAIVQEVMSGEGAIYCSPTGPGLGAGHINP